MNLCRPIWIIGWLLMAGSHAAHGQGGSWTPIATNGAPSPRCFHTAIWTGSEMIIWGGRSNATYLNTGARYHPVSNTWTAITNTGAPTARAGHTAVWTGAEMIIWGGRNGSTYYNTGARYNPVSNKWTAVTTVTPPSARANHAAVWFHTIANTMLVWGGLNGSTYYADGARYDPSSGWQSAPSSNAPSARANHTAIWATEAAEAIIWGGRSNTTYLNTGAAF